MKYLLLMLIFISQTGSAEIYKWTDESGRVNFGDRSLKPHKAEKVNVKVNSYEHVTYENIEYYKESNSKHVTMYAASWCGYCAKARKYFIENYISYTEYDIEKNEQARKIYDSIGGQGIPVILIGHTRINGFNIANFESIYSKLK